MNHPLSNHFQATSEMSNYIPENPLWFDSETHDTPSSCAVSMTSKRIKKSSKVLKPQSQKKSPLQNSSSKLQRCSWTPNEDAQAIELVSKHGPKWTKVAAIMGTRTAKQIRDRYLHKLRPNIENIAWTIKEDQLILSLHQKHGPKWAKIVQHMPNRTENQVRNRFNSKLKNFSFDNCSSLELSVLTSSHLDDISPVIKSESSSPNFEYFGEKNFILSPDWNISSEELFVDQQNYMDFHTSSSLIEQEGNLNNPYEDIDKFLDFSECYDDQKNF